MIVDITDARYTSLGSITAMVDGIETTIPAVGGNRHYDALIKQGVIIAPYVEPAKTAEQVRAERNTLLASCDWTQVADSPVDQAVWAIYRQALRDMTAQAGFPADVVWPTYPHEVI